MQPSAQNTKLKRSQLDAEELQAYGYHFSFEVSLFLKKKKTSNFQSIHADLLTVVQPDKRQLVLTQVTHLQQLQNTYCSGLFQIPPATYRKENTYKIQITLNSVCTTLWFTSWQDISAPKPGELIQSLTHLLTLTF